MLLLSVCSLYRTVEPKTDVELRQVLQCLPHSFLIPVMERAVAAHSPLFEIIFENGRDAILRFADKTELTLDSVDVNINEVVAKFYAARKFVAFLLSINY